jgi:hypothetical protein
MDDITILNIVISCIAFVLACGGAGLKYYLDVKKGATMESRIADLESGLEDVVSAFEGVKKTVVAAKS